jgi:hypothetical protein
MELRNIILSITAIFSPLAAVMAFLITYEEYKHHFPEKVKVGKKALETAVFTLAFFIVLGLLLAIILPFCLEKT